MEIITFVECEDCALQCSASHFLDVCYPKLHGWILHVMVIFVLLYIIYFCGIEHSL